MQGGELREMEWAPSTETAPLVFAWQDPPEEYGPWQWAGESGRAAGRFTAEAFTLQEGGKLRCPAGASLWLSEVRQENAFTRAGRLPGLPDGLSAMCSTRAVSGPKGQRQSGSSEKSRSVVSYPHLRLWSTSRSGSAPYAGWMWPVEPFAAPG